VQRRAANRARVLDHGVRDAGAIGVLRGREQLEKCENKPIKSSRHKDFSQSVASVWQRALASPDAHTKAKLWRNWHSSYSGRRAYTPIKPGGRQPWFAHATHTVKLFTAPSSRPRRLTIDSVEAGLLQATQVATRFLFSFAFSLGIRMFRSGNQGRLQYASFLPATVRPSRRSLR